MAEGLGDQDAYIKPGNPRENGHIESFHGKLRDECVRGPIAKRAVRTTLIVFDTPAFQDDARFAQIAEEFAVQASMRGKTRTGLMGAAPKPCATRRGRRSGGTKDQSNKVANKRKPKH